MPTANSDPPLKLATCSFQDCQLLLVEVREYRTFVKEQRRAPSGFIPKFKSWVKRIRQLAQDEPLAVAEADLLSQAVPVLDRVLAGPVGLEELGWSLQLVDECLAHVLDRYREPTTPAASELDLSEWELRVIVQAYLSMVEDGVWPTVARLRRVVAGLRDVPTLVHGLGGRLADVESSGSSADARLRLTLPSILRLLHLGPDEPVVAGWTDVQRAAWKRCLPQLEDDVRLLEQLLEALRVESGSGTADRKIEEEDVVRMVVTDQKTAHRLLDYLSSTHLGGSGRGSDGRLYVNVSSEILKAVDAVDLVRRAFDRYKPQEDRGGNPKRIDAANERPEVPGGGVATTSPPEPMPTDGERREVHDTMESSTPVGREILALVAEWQKLRESVAGEKERSGNEFLDGAELNPLLTPLEFETRRLLHLHAPWVESRWQDLSRTDSSGLGTLLGRIGVKEVVKEIDEVLIFLKSVESAERQGGTRMESGGASQGGPIPEKYSHLVGPLRQFHADYAFDRSVFVMMKFPDPAKMSQDQVDCLEQLFGAVRDELERHGLVARRADKKTYSGTKQIWDNLCIYMLGCSRGLAILEDKTGDELNPNVALEYGFMNGLGREVALLQEAGFKHLRADLAGTIPKPFKIGPGLSVDVSSVREAVGNWMIDISIPPRRAR